MPQVSPKALSDRLLDWYDRNARSLPWRAKPGEIPDPYRVWLSEIMLQQTTVVAVIPYFLSFVERWPSVGALADAPLDDVLTAWAGLGYYARARNLHRCAKVVAGRHDGFPADETALKELPGIGDYTAAAIAAIAFGRSAAVMDGNVERVMARMFAVTDPIPGAKPKLRGLAASLTPQVRPGDYAQAVMDLGATVCTPKSPACVLCPWRADCEGARLGIAASLPARAAKPPRPVRRGVAFWTERKGGEILLRRRPESGLLGGMMEIPSTPWRDEPWDIGEVAALAPVSADWRLLPGLVGHTFTHFYLELTVLAGKPARPSQAKGIWWPLDRLGETALPSVMTKVVRHALSKAY